MPLLDMGDDMILSVLATILSFRYLLRHTCRRFAHLLPMTPDTRVSDGDPYLINPTVFEWALARNLDRYQEDQIITRSFTRAARLGNIDILRYIYDSEENYHDMPQLSKMTTDAAARAGQLEALVWLRRNITPPCPFSGHIAIYAAAEGHLHILEHLNHELTEEEVEQCEARVRDNEVRITAARAAVKSARARYASVLSTHGPTGIETARWEACDAEATLESLQEERTELVRYMRYETEDTMPLHIVWGSRIISAAARHGHVRILDYLDVHVDQCNVPKFYRRLSQSQFALLPQTVRAWLRRRYPQVPVE